MGFIKKVFAGMALVFLAANLNGCLPFMAARAAKTVADKANTPSDADAKKADDASKTTSTPPTPSTQAPATSK